LVLFGNQKMMRPEIVVLDRNILAKPGGIELSVILSSKNHCSSV
jgi:hypothetical protein